MKKLCILLICLMIILCGCGTQTVRIPGAEPPERTPGDSSSGNGGFWPGVGASSSQPEQPKGGFWRLVRTECNDFEPVNDPDKGVYWNGDIVSNSIMATYIFTDKTVVNHFVEYEIVYNWAWRIEVTPTGDQDHLYYGSTVDIRLSLEYTGVDPNKYGNYGEIYAGAFGYYPPDNDLLIYGPGGIGEKVVSIEIPEGIEAGDIASIDIVCAGSPQQSFTYRYFYEWVK